MRRPSVFRTTLIVICFWTGLVAQNQPRPIETFTPLEIKSQEKVPLLGASALVMPVSCTPNGTIYVRLASPAGVEEVVSISSHDRQTVRFSKQKIYDIPNPALGTVFATDSDVYIRVTSDSNPRGVKLKLPLSDGTADQNIQTVGTRKYHIAHYKPDGTYVGGLVLDIPLVPRQIGVFANGDFLVAGMTADTREPRLALVKADGQLLRFINLQDDIRGDAPQFTEKANRPRVIPGSGGLQQAIDFSSIMQDGENLVLVRRGSQAPVFSISPSGEVTPVRVIVPSGYSLFTLNVSRDSWIAQYAYREDDGKGIKFVTYSINRSTGELMNGYSYPVPLGVGLACTTDGEFTFLKMGTDDTLSLVKAVPGSSTSENKESGGPERPD